MCDLRDSQQLQMLPAAFVGVAYQTSVQSAHSSAPAAGSHCSQATSCMQYSSRQPKPSWTMQSDPPEPVDPLYARFRNGYVTQGDQVHPGCLEHSAAASSCTQLAALPDPAQHPPPRLATAHPSLQKPSRPGQPQRDRSGLHSSHHATSDAMWPQQPLQQRQQQQVPCWPIFAADMAVPQPAMQMGMFAGPVYAAGGMNPAGMPLCHTGAVPSAVVPPPVLAMHRFAPAAASMVHPMMWQACAFPQEALAAVPEQLQGQPWQHGGMFSTAQFEQHCRPVHLEDIFSCSNPADGSCTASCVLTETELSCADSSCTASCVLSETELSCDEDLSPGSPTADQDAGRCGNRQLVPARKRCNTQDEDCNDQAVSHRKPFISDGVGSSPCCTHGWQQQHQGQEVAALVKQQLAHVAVHSGFLRLQHAEVSCYTEATSLEALFEANRRLSSRRLPGGLVFLPVSPHSVLWQMGVLWRFPAFAIALSSSYFQRLLAALPHLAAAARRLPSLTCYWEQLGPLSPQEAALSNALDGSCPVLPGDLAFQERTLHSIQFTLMFIATKLTDQMQAGGVLPAMLQAVAGHSCVVTAQQAAEVEVKCLEGLDWRLGPYFAEDEL